MLIVCLQHICLTDCSLRVDNSNMTVTLKDGRVCHNIDPMRRQYCSGTCESVQVGCCFAPTYDNFVYLLVVADGGSSVFGIEGLSQQKKLTGSPV